MKRVPGRAPVAVLGCADEEPCALLIQALQAQGTPVLLLDQRQRWRARTAWALDGQGRLQGEVQGELLGEVPGEGGPQPLNDLAGLYLRPSDERRLHRGDDAALQAATAWTQAWTEIAELATFRVANRVSAMASNSSKPLQSQCLAAAGFAIPAMLMSNDPDAVLAFEAEQGPLIYKSASGVRSIVQTLDAAARARLQAVREAPTLFQQRLTGTNVRVHVVGQEVFATEIDSDAVDYRYAGLTEQHTALRATRLPADIEARCRRAARELALPFTGLDLMLADDGLVYCFEANPSPGYSYYQNATGQDIAGALARYLAGLAD
jgi:glutathione synthase/RimK-type ligase-like ATP-grasp enzyme